MPAYNAAKTLEKTYEDIPDDLKPNVILVDDCSQDATVEIAKQLGIRVIVHEKNLGYGANQKTCYKEALLMGADVVVMLHPDRQYDARVTGVMSDLIELGNSDIILGNRIRTRREALGSGMPKWRYFLNRSSTLVEDVLLGQTISDFHSGLRAYSRDVLNSIRFEENSDDFMFDQEFLIQAVALNFRIADIPIPARYERDSSSISFKRSMEYGLGGFLTLIHFFAFKFGLSRTSKFNKKTLA
jgi:glycosyltransferase involved in cell wall biosynthesis